MRMALFLTLFVTLAACAPMEARYAPATQSAPKVYYYGAWNSTSNASSNSAAAAAPAPTPAPANSSLPGCNDTAKPERQELCELVSRYRMSFGLGSVSLDFVLNLAAQNHADDMRVNDYFAHTSLTGKSIVDRVGAYQSIINKQLGENIAKGQVSPSEVLQSWIDSPGHRANLLERNFTRMGIGHSGGYWVQDFSN